MTEAERMEYTDEEVDALLEAEAAVAELPTEDPDWGQRYMRAHRGITAAMGRNVATAARENLRIAQWLIRRSEPLQARLDRLELALRALAEHEMEASKGKRKKLSTPFGSVQLRKPGPRLIVDDAGVALEFLSCRDDYDDYKIETVAVNKTAVKKLMLDTGEVIDGCHIETDEQHGMTIKHHFEEDESDADSDGV